MDKGSVIERALSKIGAREHVDRTATDDPVRRAYDFVLRRCNALHKWSFCRVTGFAVTVVKGGDGERWREAAFIVLPDDCLRLEEIRNVRGEKIRHSEFCTDPQTRMRYVLVPGYSGGEKLFITYTCDLVNLDGNLPDYAPFFCEGVILYLAAELAESITARFDLADKLRQEGEKAMQQAIDMDARQWLSNDQHPWRDIERRDIFRF